MSSNYPPGVSGREYQISGAEREWEEKRWCHSCDRETDWWMEAYQGAIHGECENFDTCGGFLDFEDDYGEDI